MCLLIMATCKKTFTIPQVSNGGTCWFNALLSALFYSDGTSAYFKKILPSLRKKTKSKKKLEIFDIFEQLLSARDIKDTKEFSKFYTALEPNNILKSLHDKDKKHFYFNPEKQKGHSSENYLIILLQYFGIMEKVLFVNIKNDKYFFSVQNTLKYHGIEVGGKYKLAYNKREHKKTTTEMFNKTDFNKIELVVMSDLFSGDSIQLPFTFKDDKMDIFGTSFKADSLLLTNFNVNQCTLAHKVAGVTCKGKRYMYNGWANKVGWFSRFREACNLFPFDWVKENRHFCMNRKKCLISKVKKTPGKDMCFNTGKMRTFLYTKEATKPKVVKAKPNVAKKPTKPIIKNANLLKKPTKPIIKNANLLKKPTKPIIKNANSLKRVNQESPDIKLANLLKKVNQESPDIKLANLLKKVNQESPDIKLANLLKKERKPRCPNGTRRNPKTGTCEKDDKK